MSKETGGPTVTDAFRRNVEENREHPYLRYHAEQAAPMINPPDSIYQHRPQAVGRARLLQGINPPYKPFSSDVTKPFNELPADDARMEMRRDR